MAQICPLRRAPITEAIIDFRVIANERITAESIDSRLQAQDFGYYKKGPIVRGVFGFQLSTEAGGRAEALPSAAHAIGVRLHSDDEKYVAQFSTEGFTLSRLEPYETWDKLFREATRLWPIYAALVEPSVVTRAATRYINNLHLPLQSGDSFGRFLTQQPSYPPDVPQAMSSFLQRFVMHDAITESTIIITQALDEYQPGGDVPVIVDVDAFKVARFEPGGAEMWACLAQLRTLKNKFFFASLTPEAVELYR